MEYQNGKWIGEYLFGHRDPPICDELPTVYDRDVSEEDVFHNPLPLYKGKDFNGYFHFFSTRYYRPHQTFFRSLFQPAPHIRHELDEGMQHLRSRGQTVVAIHLWRGDYIKYLHHDWCYISPAEWYKSWLNSLWTTLHRPVLYIASDELDQVLDDFREFHPVTSTEVFDGLWIPQSYRDIAPNINGVVMNMDFYHDYHVLRNCDILATSNSTFSFSASMLNERAKSFYRPHYESQQLISYDPWNSDPMLTKW